MTHHPRMRTFSAVEERCEYSSGSMNMPMREPPSKELPLLAPAQLGLPARTYESMSHSPWQWWHHQLQSWGSLAGHRRSRKKECGVGAVQTRQVCIHM